MLSTTPLVLEIPGSTPQGPRKSSFIEKIISEDSTENSSEDSFVKKKLLGFLKLAESISR